MKSQNKNELELQLAESILLNIPLALCESVFLWISALRYWHLWFDINCSVASMTHEWHKIIGRNYNPSNQNININSSTININPPIAKFQNNDSNNSDKSDKSNDSNKSNKSNNSHNSALKENVLQATAPITITKQPLRYASSDIHSGIKSIEWFIKYKGSLGNVKYTLPRIILVCIFCTLCLLVTVIMQHYFNIRSTKILISVAWGVELITVPILAMLYYQIAIKLKFEDNFFVGHELKWVFWCIIIVCILWMGELIFYTNIIASNVITALYLTVDFCGIVYLTKGVLHKIRYLLNDRKFIYNPRMSSADSRSRSGSSRSRGLVTSNKNVNEKVTSVLTRKMSSSQLQNEIQNFVTVRFVL